jgi:hypothetical protein
MGVQVPPRTPRTLRDLPGAGLLRVGSGNTTTPCAYVESIFGHNPAVGDLGNRTRTTDVLMLPADELGFDLLVRSTLGDIGWLCSHPGPLGLHQVHLHPTLGDALDCGGTQAFLSLPAGASPPPGVVDQTGSRASVRPSGLAIVQLLRSPFLDDHNGRRICLGRLAVRWNELQVGQSAHELLSRETKLVWRALTASTRPAHLVSNATGRPVSGRRIGPAAHDFITNDAVDIASLWVGNDYRLVG